MVDEQIKQFQGGRVGPMEILQDEEERLMHCQFQKESEDGAEGLLFLLLGRHR